MELSLRRRLSVFEIRCLVAEPLCAVQPLPLACAFQLLQLTLVRLRKSVATGRRICLSWAAMHRSDSAIFRFSSARELWVRPPLAISPIVKRFQCFQCVAVLLELNPVPGDFAVAVATHARTPDSLCAYHDTDACRGSAGSRVGSSSTENGGRLWPACNLQGSGKSRDGIVPGMLLPALPAGDQSGEPFQVSQSSSPYSR